MRPDHQVRRGEALLPPRVGAGELQGATQLGRRPRGLVPRRPRLPRAPRRCPLVTQWRGRGVSASGRPHIIQGPARVLRGLRGRDPPPVIQLPGGKVHR